MKVVIFAGGAGTRLWPLSRKATPKQFEPFFEGKSTLQLAIDRVRDFGLENIYISTNHAYVDIVAQQVPGLDPSHIFSEPAKRDLAAAIGLTLVRMKQQGVEGSIAMLWSDHLMDRPDVFVDALKRADQLIQEDADRFVFIGEQPRYANQNLGWIHVGDALSEDVRSFKGWKYRPELDACKQMFASGEWLWNPGYFIYDIDFVLGLYKAHQPDMLTALESMVGNDAELNAAYETLPSMSFDNAIVENVDASQAVVLPVHMGWSDPGTLYAMKEALVESEEQNAEHGAVIAHETRDSFIYNEVDHQLVTTVGLDGVVVVNTPDSILVCHKDHVPKIKELLKRVEENGHAEKL